MNQAPAQAGWRVKPSNTRFQPAVAGGTLFVGSQNGNVYALDAKTGCVRWTFRASAEVRLLYLSRPYGRTECKQRRSTLERLYHR